MSCVQFDWEIWSKLHENELQTWKNALVWFERTKMGESLSQAWEMSYSGLNGLKKSPWVPHKFVGKNPTQKDITNPEFSVLHCQ